MRGAIAALALYAGAALAQMPGDPLQLLQRAASAAARLNYAGVFVYQSGLGVESSRIAHRLDNAGERERIEVLDGSPREVIRFNDEVQCFLPDQKLIIIDRLGSRRPFPSFASNGLPSVGEHYAVRRGGVVRVAERDGIFVTIEPRDNWRYKHEIWVDAATGLLLKSVLYGLSGDAIESVAFTELRVGINLQDAALTTKLNTEGWKVQRAGGGNLKKEADSWVFRTAVPGFRKVSVSHRQLHSGGAEADHFVFSDGLAAVSVFIEPSSKPVEPPVAEAVGPLNVYRRLMPGFQVIAMGDVPAATLRALAEGAERRP